MSAPASSPASLSVLHVAQPVDGGVAAYVASVSEDQAARGWRVAVACPGDGRLAERLAAGCVPRLHWPATRRPDHSVLDEARRLRDLVESFRPDVVHLHSSAAGYAGRLALRGAVPTLFQPHGWSWLAVRGTAARAAVAWERWAARWTTLIICVGEGEAELARRHEVRAPCVVVGNGVDTRRFHPGDERVRAESRELVGVPRDVPLAVCVGRVTRQKGQDLLLAAWSRVAARQPDAELALVGPVDSRLALPRNVTRGVRLVGRADDVRPWYLAADVVVQPSRWEGLPLTVLEALASGRPVVATNVVGLAEVVTPAVGALVSTGDEAALAGAIVRRFRDDDLAAAEGRAARWLARRRFDVRRTFDRLAEVTVAASAGRRPDRHPVIHRPA